MDAPIDGLVYVPCSYLNQPLLPLGGAGQTGILHEPRFPCKPQRFDLKCKKQMKPTMDGIAWKGSVYTPCGHSRS